MAPVLRAWWGPEEELVSGPGSEQQMVLLGSVMLISVLLLLSLLLMLCASCQGQKKVNGSSANEDHQNLMNGVSERETFHQSVDSPGTDLVASSSYNGLLTSGTVLTDTQDTSPHLSEEMLYSQSELRLSKCPQDRELPSIPPNSHTIPPNSHALEGRIEASADGPARSGDGTYEVVKEVAVASRDNSVEDSLYETVKELKEPPGLPNGTSLPPSTPPPGPALLNGHLSPCTPERGPLCPGVEYASVDLNKKSRYSADLEAQRSASLAIASRGEGEGEGGVEEEDRPPPVPDKVLDENDNQPATEGEVAALHNGEVHSPLSSSTDLDRHVMENDLYFTVDQLRSTEDHENDYSSIAEIKGLVPDSSSSDLYATVRDVYPQDEALMPGEGPALDSPDPGYEIICIPRTGGAEQGRGAEQTEPDYESVGELGLNRETSRL